MHFIIKKSNNCYLLNVYIKPGAKKQKIVDDVNFAFISLRSKAEKNKANKELLNLLKNKLKIPSNQIQILSGLKSSTKCIQLKFSEEVSAKEIYTRLFN